MAHIEIGVGREHHVTLAHFDESPLPLVTVNSINQVMASLCLKVQNPPTGTFRDIQMVGRFRNVRARTIESNWLLMVRAELLRMLDEAPVEYSREYVNGVLHVSKPLDSWQQGDSVPFRDHLRLHYKTADGDPVQLAYLFGFVPF